LFGLPLQFSLHADGLPGKSHHFLAQSDCSTGWHTVANAGGWPSQTREKHGYLGDALDASEQAMMNFDTARAWPGRLSALSDSHSKLILYGAFVRVRRVVRQKRRFPARAPGRWQSIAPSC
jgi:hypothetical protein